MPESTELQSLIEQRNALDKRIRELEQAQAEAASPFKLGQTITWKHGKGRRRGVILSFRGYTLQSMLVRIILKSGADGDTKRVHEWDDPKAEEVANHG